MKFRANDDPSSSPAAPDVVASGTVEAASLAEATIGALFTVTSVLGDDELAHRLRASGLWTPWQLSDAAGGRSSGEYNDADVDRG